MTSVEVLDKIQSLLPYFLIAFGIAIAATPWVGKLAAYLGAVDLPPEKRSMTDMTSGRRVHHHVPLLLGGLSIHIALALTFLLLGGFDTIPWGVWVGYVVILIVGFMDDMYELSSTQLLLGQLLAAAVVVLGGVTVESIQVAGVFIDFNLYTVPIHFGNFLYNFVFPADILTILWIVGMINVMNWVGGVDGLNGSVTGVIILAMVLISMKLGLLPYAIFLAAYLGGLWGVLPYNYHVSKIFYSSIGDFGNGYTLGVFSILAGAKLPLFLIVVGLPFVDALVVFVGRLIKHRELLKRPWRVLSVSDKTHFHHRLLDLGFTHKGVMLIETGITAIFATIGLYLSDFRVDFISLVAVGATVLIVISLLAVLQKVNHSKREKRKEIAEQQKPKVEIKVIEKDKEKTDYKY